MQLLLDQVRELNGEDQILFCQKLFEGMTLGEVIPLVKRLEEAWDVEAVPATPDWAKGKSNVVEEEVEQTSFDVIVTSKGAKGIHVVKGVRTIAHMSGLKAANDLLRELPATVLKGIDREKAEEAKKELEELGATVEIK